MKLKIKCLCPQAVLPQYMSDGAGAFDLSTTREYMIGPGASKTIDTGLAMEIPKGHVGIIFPRSSLGVKLDVDSHMGVIDSDYRGEVKVHLRNFGERTIVLDMGDRVAQMIVFAVPQMEIVEAEALSQTERGEGGFGSTGK